jgi:hypothetical protein
VFVLCCVVGCVVLCVVCVCGCVVVVVELCVGCCTPWPLRLVRIAPTLTHRRTDGWVPTPWATDALKPGTLARTESCFHLLSHSFSLSCTHTHTHTHTSHPNSRCSSYHCEPLQVVLPPAALPGGSWPEGHSWAGGRGEVGTQRTLAGGVAAGGPPGGLLAGGALLGWGAGRSCRGPKVCPIKK